MLGIPFLDVAIRAIKPCHYDDLVDRLNYMFTSCLLMFFALMISAKQYFGKPIQCWLPAEYQGGWEQYVEDYCFVQNTYFMKEPEDSKTSSIHLTKEERKEATISYYQWVPIVLVVQALLFYVPQFFWKSVNRHSGINVKEVLKAAEKASDCQSLKKGKSDNADSLIPGVACYLEDSLAFQCKLRPRAHCHNYGVSLTVTYLATKLFFFINIIIQFYIMNSFLCTDHSFWGIKNLSNLLHGVEWEVSGMFPRVTYCEFGRSHFVNYNKRTVQCVLMVNMFNEKIYIILWFWFFVLGILTGINLIYWSVVSTAPFRQQEVMKYLRVAQDLQNSDTDRRAVARFANRALRMDGVLILRFISGHVGDMVAMELTYQLWKDYIKSSVLGPSSLNANGRAMITNGQENKQPLTVDNFNYTDEKTIDRGSVERRYEIDGKKLEMDHVSDRSSNSVPLDDSLRVSVGGGYPGPPPRLSRKTTMM